MEAYIIPDWITITAGLVIHRNHKVLLGLRSPKRAAPNQWCLPTGLGAIRRDISSAFVAVLDAGCSQPLENLLKNPTVVVQAMLERHQKAFQSPAGFALAEAKWYVQLSSGVSVEQFKPLKPICQLDNKSLLVKIYFGLEWYANEPPIVAETEWPFKEVKFFSREELKNIPIAFGCDKDLDEIFWPKG